MHFLLSKTTSFFFIIALCGTRLLAVSPSDYLQCPQISLSSTLTIESQGVLDPDLQIRDAQKNVIGNILVSRDLVFRISSLELSDKDGKQIAAYNNPFFGKSELDICNKTKIGRIETKGFSGFSVLSTSGQELYQVKTLFDSEPNRFEVYSENVLIADATQNASNHTYDVKITVPEMLKDDLLPLVFGFAIYRITDSELAEDIRSIDDLVW